MAIQVNILDNGAGIEFLLSEKVYGKEIIEAHKKYHTAEIISQLKYKIVDKSDVTEFYVSPDEVKIIGELDNKITKVNSRLITAVVSPNEILDAISGLWQARLKGDILKVKRFLNRTHANAWIIKELAK